MIKQIFFSKSQLKMSEDFVQPNSTAQVCDKVASYFWKQWFKGQPTTFNQIYSSQNIWQMSLTMFWRYVLSRRPVAGVEGGVHIWLFFRSSHVHTYPQPLWWAFHWFIITCFYIRTCLNVDFLKIQDTTQIHSRYFDNHNNPLLMMWYRRFWLACVFACWWLHVE